MSASRILIATPLDGRPDTATVTKGYHDKVRELERSGSVIIPANLCFADDLARARSRCVWYALARDGWDWILWWDEDVVPADTSIVPRMIQKATTEGYDVLGAAYSRKRIPAAFPYKPLAEHLTGKGIVIHNDVVEVEHIGFGFILTSRKCLEDMVAHYAHEWFTDKHEDKTVHETVALFKQVHTDETSVNYNGTPMRYRELLSEDYSFCWRWRRMGRKIGMYMGEGSPMAHIGGHRFEGTQADLGRIE